MGTSQLQELLAILPAPATIASAEMVMGVLVYREIELRRQRGNGRNVLRFPSGRPAP